MKKVITTLINPNFKDYALVMIQSFLRYNEDYDAVVFSFGEVQYRDKRIKVINLNKDINSNRSGVNIVETIEMNRAYTHLKLLENYDLVVYSDSDILFFDKIKDDYPNMMFTPHVYKYQNTTELARYMGGGFINIGFYVLPNNENTKKWLSIWHELSLKRLQGVNMNVNGQRYWAQSIYQFLPWCDVKYILESDAGLNVAYWNLHERTISKREGKYFVNGMVPLICYHFSGYMGDGFISRYCRKPVPSCLKDIYINYSSEIRRARCQG